MAREGAAARLQSVWWNAKEKGEEVMSPYSRCRVILFIHTPKSNTILIWPGSLDTCESNKRFCPKEPGHGWPQPGPPAEPPRGKKSNTPIGTARVSTNSLRPFKPRTINVTFVLQLDYVLDKIWVKYYEYKSWINFKSSSLKMWKLYQ
jgi:hypothetical protein